MGRTSNLNKSFTSDGALEIHKNIFLDILNSHDTYEGFKKCFYNITIPCNTVLTIFMGLIFIKSFI